MNCRKCLDRGYVTEPGGETAVAKVCACRSPCPQCQDAGWLFDTRRTPPVSSPCECRYLRSHVSRYNEAGIPAFVHGATLEKYEDRGGTQKLVQHELKRFQQNYRPGNRGFLLWGPPGTGKTHLACALLRHFALERGLRVRFVDFFHLLADLRATFGTNQNEEALISPLVDVDVLVIDELGKGRASEWEVSVLDQLVSRRYNAGRTLLATSNFEPTEGDRGVGAAAHLVDRVGDRTFSRLVAMCEFFEVKGPDGRREKTRFLTSAAIPRVRPMPTPAPAKIGDGL